jgi:excisionase family DNA binding protein
VKLGVSSKTVRRMINRGELPVHRIGRLLRVGEHALYAGLAEGPAESCKASNARTIENVLSELTQ